MPVLHEPIDRPAIGWLQCLSVGRGDPPIPEFPVNSDSAETSILMLRAEDLVRAARTPVALRAYRSTGPTSSLGVRTISPRLSRRRIEARPMPRKAHSTLSASSPPVLSGLGAKDYLRTSTPISEEEKNRF
jgi:hypothetical protein